VRKRTDKQARVEKDNAEEHEQDEQPTEPPVAQALAPEEQQPYLSAMITAASDAMIALDDRYNVLDMNPAAYKVLGFSASEAIGRPCTQILHCQNLNHMALCGTSSCPLTRVLENSRPLPNLELLIGSKPELASEVSVSVTPVSFADTTSAIFIARDVTAIQVANRVRANFVSMVSHELRTPLNSVHGFIELLLQGHMGALGDEQRIYLGYTQEGVLQLISIVEDILFMTRSDIGQFEIKQQEIPFRSLVRQVISGLKPQALKAEVALSQEIPLHSPSVYIDPQRIKQVLNNLITNAIKFTPPGGSVVVSAHRDDEQFEMISVTDTGYGIPPEDGQHIFERFYQSNHSEQSKMGGYGLGLSIAKLIVEQHGGTIGFNTQLDKGTTFYFTLPIYHGQQPAT
jgi:signal transduction histidine kinase